MNLKFSLLSLAAALTGCSSMDPAVIAMEQMSSGALVMPTQENPVAHGDEGIFMLYVANADNGAETSALGHYGYCTQTPCQWNPQVNEGRPFGMYTAPDGKQAFLTQFQYPNQGRGNAAEPGSVMVAWDTEDTDAEGQGVVDGYYDLPDEADYIVTVSDCGKPHSNYYFGWDEYGEKNLPEDPSDLGEPYCGES